MVFSLCAAAFVAMCAAYVLLDFQLLRGLRKIRALPAGSPPTVPFVTALIAARNEQDNLPRTLNALLAQDFPRERLQIVVVDDRSDDSTASVLREYANRNSDRVESVTIAAVPPGISPKKYALSKGLELARGEWIVATDADCLMEHRWLTSLCREFDGRAGMVLGVTCYQEPKSGFGAGQGAQALEFASYGVVSAALVGLGFPVHANANNLAYRRQAFDEAAAFEKHGHVVSGDDDFALQEIHATGRWAIRFCGHPDALMRTTPPESWSHFWEQRKRWASKCGLYRPRQTAFLAGIFAFYAAVPLLILAGLWDARFAWLGLAGFSIKTVADYAVMRRGLAAFGLSPLLRFFPFAALLHIPLILAAVVAGSWGGFTWKGQRMGREVKA